jgi:hypothetical protein
VCQGYDPIFKAQAQPSSIQAAPNTPPTAHPPATPVGYPPTTQPYMTAAPYSQPPPPGAPGPMPSQQYGIDPSLEQSAPPLSKFYTILGDTFG